MVHAIFLTVTNLKMTTLPSKTLIASFHRMFVVALVRFSECKDSPVLVDIGELQVRELLVENPLDLSFALDAVHP